MKGSNSPRLDALAFVDEGGNTQVAGDKDSSGASSSSSFGARYSQSVATLGAAAKDESEHKHAPSRKQMSSPFKPYNEKTREGYMMNESRALAHLCNSADRPSSLLGGHAILALEALINEQYVAIRTDIVAIGSQSSWNPFGNEKFLMSSIRYQKATASYEDSSMCAKACDKIFRQGVLDFKSCSSTSSRAAEQSATSSSAAEQSATSSSAAEVVVRIDQCATVEISIEMFHAIQNNIFIRRITFAKALANSILLASQDEALWPELSRDAETISANDQEKFNSISVNLSSLFRSSLKKGAIYVHSCTAFLKEIESESMEPPPIEYQHELAANFIRNIPSCVFPTLHKLNARGELDSHYQKFRLSGPTRYFSDRAEDEDQDQGYLNCLAWAKGLLSEVGVKTIKTNAPKKM
jgi:hypothetical protein